MFELLAGVVVGVEEAREEASRVGVNEQRSAEMVERTVSRRRTRVVRMRFQTLAWWSDE